MGRYFKCFLNIRFFVRKEFQPSSVGTSTLFTYFAQHFTHQVFKSQEKIGLYNQRILSMPSTYNNYHSLDLNNIYGDTEDIISRLRWVFFCMDCLMMKMEIIFLTALQNILFFTPTISDNIIKVFYPCRNDNILLDFTMIAICYLEK